MEMPRKSGQVDNQYFKAIKGEFSQHDAKRPSQSAVPEENKFADMIKTRQKNVEDKLALIQRQVE